VAPFGMSRGFTCDHLVTYSGLVTDDDRVFKALADPTRRFLLDLLFERDGRTLTELESELEMTRFGVMKHLKVLEEAGLVVTRRVGREKLHHLNPVPIRLIHDRWIDKYTERQVSALANLKAELEARHEHEQRPGAPGVDQGDPAGRLGRDHEH
jgi:DNA-binding transcriptional ArsR family regulator